MFNMNNFTDVGYLLGGFWRKSKFREEMVSFIWICLFGDVYKIVKDDIGYGGEVSLSLYSWISE